MMESGDLKIEIVDLGRERGIGDKGGKEGNVLFNHTLNTFYLWLYGIK